MNFFRRLFQKPSYPEKTVPKVEVNKDNLNEGKSIELELKKEDVPNTLKLIENYLTIEEKNELIEKIARGEENINDVNTSYFDPLLEDAARLIVTSQMASTSLIQRRFKLGYNRSGRIMDILERIGVVGKNQGSKAREIFIKSEDVLNQFIQNGFKFHKFNLVQFMEDNKAEIEEKKIQFEQKKEEETLRKEKELIKQELLEKERKKQLYREVLKELSDEGIFTNQATENQRNRETIPQDVLDKVWNRDGGKCVRCGSNEHIEFDHIIPFSKGGSNTYKNLQILCKKCNIQKSNKIG